MKCSKCGENKRKVELMYDEKTFELYCMSCSSDGILYTDIDSYLNQHFPELLKMSNKAVSSRLSLSQIIYMMKFAQEYMTGNISGTLSGMIDELRDRVPLNHVQLEESPFTKVRRTHKGKGVHTYLSEKPIKKQTLTVGTPEEAKEIVKEIEDQKESEDVFTI